MAQLWYDFNDIPGDGIPAGFRSATKTDPADSGTELFRSNIASGGALAFQKVSGGSITFWLATDDQFGDCDVLLIGVQQSYNSTNILYNGGVNLGVGVSLDSSGAPISGSSAAVGSSTTESVRRTLMAYSSPNLGSNIGSMANALPALDAAIDIRERTVLIRMTRNGQSVAIRAWHADLAEPVSPQLSITGRPQGDGHIAVYSLAASNATTRFAISAISVATDGDPLLYAPASKTISGIAPAPYAGLPVRARGKMAGNLYGESVIGVDGAWSIEVIDSHNNPDFNVLAVVDGGEVLLPRSGGSGYLAGEFPDGITTVGGAPVEAIVRVLLRTDEMALGDGALVRQVQSAPDGTWRVDGLDPALRYDVIGRKAGFNDVIMANVSPEVE